MILLTPPKLTKPELVADTELMIHGWVLGCLLWISDHEIPSMHCSNWWWSCGYGYIIVVLLSSYRHVCSSINRWIPFKQGLFYDSGYGFSQWEKLHCNIVTHWLIPYPEWSPFKLGFECQPLWNASDSIYHVICRHTSQRLHQLIENCPLSSRGRYE